MWNVQWMFNVYAARSIFVITFATFFASHSDWLLSSKFLITISRKLNFIPNNVFYIKMFSIIPKNGLVGFYYNIFCRFLPSLFILLFRLPVRYIILLFWFIYISKIYIRIHFMLYLIPCLIIVYLGGEDSVLWIEIWI